MKKEPKQASAKQASPEQASQPRDAVPSKTPGKRFRGWRGWLLRLTLVVAAPLLFLCLLEAGLRLCGYGYPTEFFVGPNADGTYVTNYRFGHRFFPTALARRPVPCNLAAKPDGTIRIVVLGSSSAMGTPDPSFSFGRILEVMLHARYPGRKFEVVNGAMTAINSHVTLEIARDCAAHKPDLFVIYMGNNEVVGPYGPGTVFQAWSPSLTWVRASTRLRSQRTGQLLDDLSSRFRGKEGQPTSWQGMEMFTKFEVAADDPRLAVVYDNFRRNLADICAVAKSMGAKTVLSTVAVNLDDCPPLASAHRRDLSPQDLTRWDEVFRAAAVLETQTQWAEAAKKYEQAAAIDDRFAELHYRLGRCLAAAGRTTEARERFALACDLDALRFRADSHINAIVRATAAEQPPDITLLADAEAALAGGAGRELFYEHVHFTFHGKYLLARCILDSVSKALPQSTGGNEEGGVPSERECAESLVLTPLDEWQMAESILEITAKPPFTNQFDHAARQDAARQRVAELRRAATSPETLQAAWKAHKAAVTRRPDDLFLRALAGRAAVLGNQPELAVEDLQAFLDKAPWESNIRSLLINALIGCKRFDEAMAQCRTDLELFPDRAGPHYNMGLVSFYRGEIDESIVHFHKALEIEPDDPVAHYQFGKVYLEGGKADEAMAQYRKAIELKPDYSEARVNLATMLDKRGEADEAMAQYRKAVESEPDNGAAHYGLAAILMTRGQMDEAIIQYRKTLEIQPEHAHARLNLGASLLFRRQYHEAVPHLRKAIELMPADADAYVNLGIALRHTGKAEEAIASYRRALELQPGNVAAEKNLGVLLRARQSGPADEPASKP